MDDWGGGLGFDLRPDRKGAVGDVVYAVLWAVHRSHRPVGFLGNGCCLPVAVGLWCRRGVGHHYDHGIGSMDGKEPGGRAWHLIHFHSGRYLFGRAYELSVARMAPGFSDGYHSAAGCRCRLILPERIGKMEDGYRARHGFLAAEYRKNLWIGSLIFGTMLIGMWAIFSWLPTWVQSLSGIGDAQHQRGISMMMMGALVDRRLYIRLDSPWHRAAKDHAVVFCHLFRNGLLPVQAESFFFRCRLCGDCRAGSLFRYQPGGVIGLYSGIVPDRVCAAATGFCFNVGAGCSRLWPSSLSARW